MELLTHQKHQTEEKEKALNTFFSKTFPIFETVCSFTKNSIFKSMERHRAGIIEACDRYDRYLAWKGHRILLHIPLFTSEHFLTNSTPQKKRTKDINAIEGGKISGSKKIQPTYPSTNHILRNTNSQIYLIAFHFRSSSGSSLFPAISSHHSSLCLIFQPCFQLIFSGF